MYKLKATFGNIHLCLNNFDDELKATNEMQKLLETKQLNPNEIIEINSNNNEKKFKYYIGDLFFYIEQEI